MLGLVSASQDLDIFVSGLGLVGIDCGGCSCFLLCHCEASLKHLDFFSMNFGWGGFCCIALIPDHPS